MVRSEDPPGRDVGGRRSLRDRHAQTLGEATPVGVVSALEEQHGAIAAHWVKVLAQRGEQRIGVRYGVPALIHDHVVIYRGLAAVIVGGIVISMVFSLLLLPSLMRLMSGTPRQPIENRSHGSAEDVPRAA
jgi:hypothetical protein